MSTSDTSAAPTAGATPGACPRCGAPLRAAGDSCLDCHLELHGPWVVELNDLNRHHEALRRYRSEVLERVTVDLEANERRRAEVLDAVEATNPTVMGAPTQSTVVGQRSTEHRNGLGTQALLLALGVLCLAIAVVVFAAVGWGRLGETGQAAVLLTATVIAGFGGLALHRRGLRATGEAVLCLAATMVLVDSAVFGEALGAGTGDLRFWSGGLAVLTGLGVATWRWGGSDGAPAPVTGGVVGAVAAQLTLPIAVAAALGEPSISGFDLTLWDPRLTQVGTAGVAIVGIVQAVVVALAARERRWTPSSPVVATAMLTATVVWVVAACLSLALTEPSAMAALLAGAAIAAALAAALPQLNSAWANLASAGTAATALGAWATMAPDALSSTVWLALGAALALLAAGAGPQRSRLGGVAVAITALAGTAWLLLAAAGHALYDFLMRISGTPGGADEVARHSWAEVLTVAMIVTSAGLGALLGDSHRENRRLWIDRLLVAVAVLVGSLAFVLPPLIGVTRLTWAIILAATAAAGALVTVTGTQAGRTRGVGWVVTATIAAASLMLAHVGDDLGLWWVVILAIAALALLTGRAGRVAGTSALAGVDTVLTVVAASSTAALLDVGPAWVAITAVGSSAAFAVAAAGLLWATESLSPSSPVARWVGNEVTSATARSVVSVALAAQAFALLAAVADATAREAAVAGTATLLIGAFGWFAVSLLTHRTFAAFVGATLTQCAAWFALGITGVTLVEAYTVPGSLVLLAIGAEAMRRSPQQSSWTALSPALVFALVPSGLVAIGEGGPRTLVLIGVGAVLVIVGAVLRLGAPVVAGAACVVALSLVEVAPVIGSLPRYVTFGTVGAVLLVVGATFERRRAELSALHRQLRALR